MRVFDAAVNKLLNIVHVICVGKNTFFAKYSSLSILVLH